MSAPTGGSADAWLIADSEAMQNDPRCWRPRLIRRKYVDLIRPEAAREWSVWIQYQGARSFFPLGTEDQTRAAAKALEIYNAVVTRGWREVCQTYPREFSLGIFWLENPATCTYTSLFTEVGSGLTGASRSGRAASVQAAVPVYIIEPESPVLHALVRWISGLAGYRLGGTFTGARQAVAQLHAKPRSLVLYNRTLPDLPDSRHWQEWQQRQAGVLCLGHAVYETGDHIFMSLTGVEGGYFFRRRAPMELLDPVKDVWEQGGPSLERVRRSVRDYFSSLLESRNEPGDVARRANLTVRESEILRRLSHGCADKQIAEALNISAWTVHNHLKSIFRKLGVHSRTEAVVRFLQK